MKNDERMSITTDKTINQEIVDWTVMSYLPEPINNFEIVKTKDKLHIIACDSKYYQNGVVFTSDIDDKGNLSKFYITRTLPYSLYNPKACIINDKVYLFSSWIFGNNPNYVLVSQIEEDGYLGRFEIIKKMPHMPGLSKILMLKNKIYLMGGCIGLDFNNNTHVIRINENNELGEIEVTYSIPNDILRNFQTVIINNHLFLIGGISEESITKIYLSFIDENGNITKWEEYGEIDEQITSAEVIKTENSVYLIGGESIYESNRNIKDTVYIADIIDCEIRNWRKSKELPEKISNHKAVTVGDNVYLLGGDIEKNNNIYPSDVILVGTFL